MKSKRLAIKAFAGTVAAAALVLSSFAAAGPVQAKKDTGWDVIGSGGSSMQISRSDTGWD